MNSRLDEVQAAMLRIKLHSIDEITEKKRYLAKIYLESLDRNKFQLPAVDSDYFDVYHIFQIRTKKRDELKQYLLDNFKPSDKYNEDLVNCVYPSTANKIYGFYEIDGSEFGKCP